MLPNERRGDKNAMLFTEMFRNSIFLVVAVQGDIERRLIQVPKSIHAHQKSIHEASESALHAWDKNKVVCFSEKIPQSSFDWQHSIITFSACLVEQSHDRYLHK